MKKIYNAIIVGCGQIAGGYDEKNGGKHVFTHAGAYGKHARFRLVAAADSDAQRLKRFCKLWHIPKFQVEYRTLLRTSDPEIVSVCVPDKLHREVVDNCLKYTNAKAILLEKPIALNYAEAAATVAACRKRKVSLIVNYTRLWDPLHSKVRNLIARGFLGNIQCVSGFYVRGLMHNGTTLISTLRYLMDKPIRAVQALDPLSSRRLLNPPLDGRLIFEDGIVANLFAADKGGYGHSLFEMDFMGSRGRLILKDNGFRLEAYKTAPYSRYPGVRELVPNDHVKLPESRMDRTLLATLDSVATALDSGKTLTSQAKAAAWDIRIAEALLDSSRNGGRRVRLPLEGKE